MIKTVCLEKTLSRLKLGRGLVVVIINKITYILFVVSVNFLQSGL